MSVADRSVQLFNADAVKNEPHHHTVYKRGREKSTVWSVGSIRAHYLYRKLSKVKLLRMFKLFKHGNLKALENMWI